MPSGHYMLDVAQNEVVLHFGLGCELGGGNCFKCRLKDCKDNGQKQGHREVVKEKDVVSWLNEAENRGAV